MRILILGGDGYIGWPAAMYFSKQGHHVTVLDNLWRRNTSVGLGMPPLLPAPDLVARAKAWYALSGKTVRVVIGDMRDEAVMTGLFTESARVAFGDFEQAPGYDAVIHLAEQPSAPYSMMGRAAGMETLDNNVLGTASLIYALKAYSPTAHIIKLGTMGEYGTPNIDIEEGWLDIEHNGRKDRFLFPRAASSIYHTTKIMDTDLLWFWVRTSKLRVTDLMQGPVYGLEPFEEALPEELLPHFNYDAVFGTVVNRFMAQAVSGTPLTIYGKGGQTRGYINLKDTLACLNLALNSEPAAGEMRVFNQITETFSVRQLADKVASCGARHGVNVAVENIPNPRIEKEEHYYNPKYSGLQELGLAPHFMDDACLDAFWARLWNHRERVMSESAAPKIKW